MSAPACPLLWPRAIIHVDMDAFFASIEQRDFPELRGHPVAVTNGELGSCIITCSYEARARGVHTGMRLPVARRLCPDLIQRPARPDAYAAVSSHIMRTLEHITPDIEVYSVDEAFLDVTRCQRLHGTPARMALMAQQRILATTGLSCSIGISGDKTTAKFAAQLNKPGGLSIIPPWEARARLTDEPVTALSGIAAGIGEFLAAHGVYRCGQMRQLPVSVLARRFGNLGRRIWLMCQGEDPDSVHLEVPPPKSIGHGKVMPPATRDRDTILTYLRHMSEKVAQRLRRHDMAALQFFIGLHTRDGWHGERLRLPLPSDDGHTIYRLCQRMLANCWQGEAVQQCQVTALDPRPRQQQLELFTECRMPTSSAAPDAARDSATTHDEQANRVMDDINRRYGDFTLTPARLLKRSTMPNVIAPAWRPTGPRQSI